MKRLNRDQWKEMLQSIDCVPMTPKYLFELVCGLIAEREGVEYVVEKTPHHVNWIPRIVRAFPDAKFVVMVRDPYGFMLSYKHQGDRKLEPARRDFRALYHPLGCAYIWRKYMKSAIRNSKGFPDQTMTLKFEELKQSPVDSWKRLVSFCEMPDFPFTPVADKNSSFQGEERKLAPIDIFWMNVIGRSQIHSGGYSLRKSGVSFRDILISIWELCPWFIRALKLLKSRVPGGLAKYFLRSGK